MQITSRAQLEGGAELRSFTTLQSRAIDLKKRTLVGMFSTPDPDSYETIFRAEGWRKHMEQYMRGPVILQNHNPDILPLARTYDWDISPAGLKLAIEFVDDELPFRVLRMYDGGFLNQFSQRSRIYDAIFRWDEERRGELLPSEKAAFEAGRAYVTFVDQLLIEGSCVTLAGNSWAGVCRAVEEGVLTADQARSLCNPAPRRVNLAPVPAPAPEPPPEPVPDQRPVALRFFSDVLDRLGQLK